jgi:hypothetical protein
VTNTKVGPIDVSRKIIKIEFIDEELIKFGFDNDVWFHVDKLSSAHVYLRLQQGEKWDQIPQEMLEMAAQLCKANSIEGKRMDNRSAKDWKYQHILLQLLLYRI